MSRSKKSPMLPEPTDFIDLTQDSPSNVALRTSRNRVRRISTDLPTIESVDNESVTILGPVQENHRNKKQRISKQEVVINLDETINLDDSLNNVNLKKPTPVLQGSQSTNKRSLSCPICLENLEDENIKAMTTPCGHVYCLECLQNITHSKKKCSICQRSISFTKCIRLHI